MSRTLRTMLFTTLSTPVLLLAAPHAQPASAAPAPSFASPVVATAGSAAARPATAVLAAAKKFKNCTALNAVHPHGVAKPGAADLVRGSTKPVTTFKVAPKVYAANTHLDRDKDGVACEKR